LDNVEDLLDDHGQFLDEDLQLFFDRSLTTAHGARLLVTSRISLALRREVVRFDQQVKLLEGLPVADGVALLRELDPNGNYDLRDAPEQQLAEAVLLTHGVPRALEVIVGILANDPFASLGDVLERFYEQQDVVHALIEENYKRLDRNARQVIEALAVFRRPVPPLAVDYLLEPFAPGLDVPGIMRHLTRTNTVSVDRATKMVTLHPIDQDYAYSQLPEEGAGEPAFTRRTLERRAADYYVQLRTPPETWKTIDDLEPQLVEFEHRVRAGDYDDACRLLDPIDYEYLFRWGHYRRLVELREELLSHLEDPSWQATNLGRLGNAYVALGQIERAVNLYDKAVTISHEINNLQSKSIWLSRLANAYCDLGQIERAIKLQDEALTIDRDIGERAGEGFHLGNLGRFYFYLGQIGRAIEFYERSLAIAREVGDQWMEENRLGDLGLAYRNLGQIKPAIELYQEALSIAREIGDRMGEERHLGNLGLAYRALGRFEQAVEFYGEALAIARKLGDRRGEGMWLGNKGLIHHALGQIDQAIELYQEALVIYREIKYRFGESYCLLELGRALLTRGDSDQARQCCTEALALDVVGSGYIATLVLAACRRGSRVGFPPTVFNTTCQ